MCSYATTSLLSAGKEVMYSNIEKNSINCLENKSSMEKLTKCLTGNSAHTRTDKHLPLNQKSIEIF